MEKTTDEKNIIILHSISELTKFLKENEGSIVSVQVELEEAAASLEKGGGGSD